MDIKRVFPSLFLLCALFLTGCASPAARDGNRTEPAPAEQPVQSTDPSEADVAPKSGEAEEFVSREASIQSVEVVLLESFPVQAEAQLTGERSACEEIDSTNATLIDDTFVVEVTLRAPAEVVCTMQVVFFETTVTLPVEGLKAGTYRVQAGEVEDSFTLEVDNVAGE